MSDTLNLPVELIDRCRWVTPKNSGWLQYQLNQKELDFIGKCIEKSHQKKKSINPTLAGNISNSWELEDTQDWFFENTLYPLTLIYGQEFGNKGKSVPIIDNHPYRLWTWWVNYQKKHEFNPIHDHSGVYSFVIWLKIPTEHKDQNKGYVTNTPTKSAFCFHYTDILGHLQTHYYQLGKEWEGTLLFFPSTLKHEVYPFYNCDEDRISISGNIFIDEYTSVDDANNNESLISISAK